mgnify:FL=1
MCLLWYNKFVKKFVKKFVYGRGHRKTVTQRYYEKLCKYRDKLSENVQIGVADEYIAVVDVIISEVIWIALSL